MSHIGPKRPRRRSSPSAPLRTPPFSSSHAKPIDPSIRECCCVKRGCGGRRRCVVRVPGLLGIRALGNALRAIPNDQNCDEHYGFKDKRVSDANEQREIGFHFAPPHVPPRAAVAIRLVLGTKFNAGKGLELWQQK